MTTAVSDLEQQFESLPSGAQHNIRTLLRLLDVYVPDGSDYAIAMNHLRAMVAVVAGAQAQRDMELERRTKLEIAIRTADVRNPYVKRLIDAVASDVIQTAKERVADDVFGVLMEMNVTDGDACLLAELFSSDFADLEAMPERYADIFRRVADVLTE